LSRAGGHARPCIGLVAGVCLIASSQAALGQARSTGPTGPAATREARPRRGRGASPRPLTDKQVADLMAFARKHDPDLAGKLDRLLRKDRSRAMRMLRHLNRTYQEARRYPDEIARAAVDRRNASVAIYRAVRELAHTTGPAARAEATERIKKLLIRHFDLEQKVKEYEVARLERRVARLAEEVKARRGRSDEVIATRLERLLHPRKPSTATAPATQSTSRRGRRPPHTRRRRVTDRQFAEIMTFTRKYMPELAPRLEAIRKRDSRRSDQLLHAAYGFVRQMRAMPPNVREAAVGVHRANVSLFRKAAEARAATGQADREPLVRSMRQLLAEQFQNEQTVREYEVTRLRGELSSLRAGIEQRVRDRQKIIAERLEQLTSPRRPATATAPARR